MFCFFDKKDEILFNRDDQLYIEQLKDSQSDGKITVVMADKGGHMTALQNLFKLDHFRKLLCFFGLAK